MPHPAVERVIIRGWEVLRMRSVHLEVDVVPGKGADILSVRWLPRDLDLLWRSPWGLRQSGTASTSPSGPGVFLENYPGGWQTIFPNGGAAAELGGVEQPFHGEAALAAWDWRDVSDGEIAAVEMTTRLARSPFLMTKRVTVLKDSVEIRETVANEGSSPQDVMWSHHPAFGAPLLGSGCRIEAAARTFVVDDERDATAGDLEPGTRSAWPHARGRGGNDVDLTIVPGEETACDRFGYLLDFTEGRMAIVNERIGVRATLRWDLDVMPCAWYWLEAHATPGYPWFGAAYVLGLEPASSYPGQGLATVRKNGGNLVHFDPGQERTARVALTVSDAVAD